MKTAVCTEIINGTVAWVEQLINHQTASTGLSLHDRIAVLIPRLFFWLVRNLIPPKTLKLIPA